MKRCGVNCTLAGQCQHKTGLSLHLVLDIKDAVNAVDHCNIFIMLEAEGFQAVESTMMSQIYCGSFLSISNLFGETASYHVLRALCKGDPHSQLLFIVLFDLFPKVISAIVCGCSLTVLEDTSDSSQFVDRVGEVSQSH